MKGKVQQINISQGGVPKRPVQRTKVSLEGLEGDIQRDKKHHGGPDKAVSLWSMGLIEALVAEGHPVTPGSTGENLTIAGLVWSELGPGDRLGFEGGVVLEVTEHAVPCKNIQGSFLDGKMVRISQKLHPGWSRLYARVLQVGEIEAGETVEVLPIRGA